MLTDTLKNDLLQIRKGILDTTAPLSFDQISGKSLIDEIVVDFPVVFQRRDHGRKHEIAVARKFSYEMTFRTSPNSLFPSSRIIPIISRCFLISTYDDKISEVTWANKISFLPVTGKADEIALKFGSGFKLDHTPDGWTLKPLLRRKVVLSQAFLKNRGWQFNVLSPIGGSAQ
jgi:hypothetical protein